MNEERFSGDMSRNEVEIDLNKFMAMVQEIGELKQKIMELENDKEPDNPWQNWIWFMELETPTFEQSGLISVVVGAGAAWFGLYAGTAKDKINSN